MNPEEFRNRTKAFALRVIRLVEALSKSRAADVIGRQLLRCGTSVGANYRAACRAKSPADFIAKMKIVEEECDEAVYWMELLTEGAFMKEKRISDLENEANEILSMVVASIKTARTHKQSSVRNPQSAIGNPQSAIGNPQSAIGNPQSAIGNPQSAIGNPQSAIRKGEE